MMRTPSLAHERGISIRTSAPIVVKMNLLANPIVHENAPSTAPPIVEKMLPTAPPTVLMIGPMIGMLAVTSGT
jgi:hypothetical protein